MHYLKYLNADDGNAWSRFSAFPVCGLVAR
jgi:hypothetical protein